MPSLKYLHSTPPLFSVLPSGKSLLLPHTPELTIVNLRYNLTSKKIISLDDLKLQLNEIKNENSDLIKQNKNYKEQIKAYKNNTSIMKSLTTGDIAYSQYNVNDY